MSNYDLYNAYTAGYRDMLIKCAGDTTAPTPVAKSSLGEHLSHAGSSIKAVTQGAPLGLAAGALGGAALMSAGGNISEGAKRLGTAIGGLTGAVTGGKLMYDKAMQSVQSTGHAINNWAAQKVNQVTQSGGLVNKVTQLGKSIFNRNSLSPRA